MKSFEMLKIEPTSVSAGNKENKLGNDRERYAESFEKETRLVEAQRLCKPEGSAYDNLKRFGRRAINLGLLLSSLAVAPEALSQTYRPYIEGGSLEALGMTVPFNSKNKTPELEGRYKEVRQAVEQILTRIGEAEKLPLAKLDVDIIVKPLAISLSGQPIDADFSQERMLLRVKILKDFDINKHAKALEAMLAHEIGHFINESNNQDISKHEDTARRQALQKDPEINKEWTALDSKKNKIESAKAPRLKKINNEIKELTRRLAVEYLTLAEGKKIRDQLDALETQVSEIEGDLIETDADYRGARNRLQEIEESLRPKVIQQIIKQGGPEVIADFFQARWAVKQGWSTDELKEAMKILIGESGQPSSPLYGPTIEGRHKLVQFLFNRIKKEPERYYKVGSNSQEIHDCVEGLYKEFSKENLKSESEIKQKLTP